MSVKKLVAISVLTCICFSAGIASFAEIESSDPVEPKLNNITLPKKHVNYSELRERVLKQSTVLKDLKKSEEALVKGLDSFDNPYIHLTSSDLSYNTTGSRDGYYYGYARPIIIEKANLQAQSVELLYNMNKFKSELEYQLQNMLIEIGTSEEQLNLYSKKAELLKVKYAQAQASYSKGLSSKVQLLGAETEFKQTLLAVQNMSYQVKRYKLKVAELAALESGYDYSFEVPIDTVSNYSLDKLESYFISAKSSNQDLSVELAKELALKKEEEVIRIYNQFMLKTDLLDFQRRKEAQLRYTKLVEDNVYRELRTLLNQLEDARSDKESANDKVDIARLDFDAAVQRYQLGKITEVAMDDAKLALYSAQLDYSGKLKQYNKIVKKVDVFINAGIHLDGGQ